jgi:uncharacterized phiE125 gp8 family phage protein
MEFIRPEYWKVSVEPTVAAVTTATAKAHCRVDYSADDALIEGLCFAATKRIEAMTGLALINQTIRVEMLEAPPVGSVIMLPIPPAQSITSIAYTDNAGASQTLAASAYSLFNGAATEALLLEADGYAWPMTREGVGSFVITYAAGFGSTAAAVPYELRQAVLLLVGSWYSNREGIAPVEMKRIPDAVLSLISSWARGWV